MKSLEKSLAHGICPVNISHYTVISCSILKCCLFPFSLSPKSLEHPYEFHLILVLFNSTFCRAWRIWDFWFFCPLMITYMFRHMNLWNWYIYSANIYTLACRPSCSINPSLWLHFGQCHTNFKPKAFRTRGLGSHLSLCGRNFHMIPHRLVTLS